MDAWMIAACLMAAIALLVGIIKTWRDIARRERWLDDNGSK